MTLSLKRRSLCKPKRGEQIHLYDLGVMRARNKNKAHSLLLEIFQESGMTKAEIAKMLGKKPEQVTRWLAGPGNLTLETLSDLIFAIRGEAFTLSLKDDLSRAKSNRKQPDWLQTIDPPKWEQVSLSGTKEPEKEMGARYSFSVSSPKEKTYERYEPETHETFIAVI